MRRGSYTPPDKGCHLLDPDAVRVMRYLQGYEIECKDRMYMVADAYRRLRDEK